MVEVNLLPEEQSREKHIDTFFFSRNVSLVVSIMLVIGAIGIAAALFGYRYYIELGIQDIKKETSGLSKSIDRNILPKIVALDRQITSLKKILEKHNNATELFIFLEENTLHHVSFKSLGANIKKSELNLSGTAASYSILAKQMSHLKSLIEVSEVSVFDVALSPEGGVSFSLRVKLKPDVFVK